MKNKIIVICGPTASGKTSLSIELAKKIDGQIVSADSMQIYDEINIGTAKPSKEEMQGIKHYLIGNVPITKRYSVSDFKKDAEEAIEQILKDGKNPIVVGGTGLYINSLVYGIEYPDIDVDLEYRDKLEKIAAEEGLEKLYKKACEIDEQAMQKISPNDKKRILRVLEIYNATGKNKTFLEEKSRENGTKYNYDIYAINFDRETLYNRINKRVDKMIVDGLIEETEKLYKKYGDSIVTGAQAIGYKEVVEYIKGETNKEEMIEKIKMETRRYAKRQITWFKKIDNIKWINGEDSIDQNISIILNNY